MVAINGKDYAAAGKNLSSVLTEMKYDFRTIAVEINEEIVSKQFYEETIYNFRRKKEEEINPRS